MIALRPISRHTPPSCIFECEDEVIKYGMEVTGGMELLSEALSGIVVLLGSLRRKIEGRFIMTTFDRHIVHSVEGDSSNEPEHVALMKPEAQVMQSTFVVFFRRTRQPSI